MGPKRVMAKFPQLPTLNVYAELERIWRLGPFILGLSYGVVEYFFVSSSPFAPIFVSAPLGYLYRLIYVTILFLPFASRNYWRWFANGAFAMTVQDASYWAFDYWKTGALPVQWAWYYPVWNSIPLLYLALPMVLLSAWKGRQWGRMALGVQEHLSTVKSKMLVEGQGSASAKNAN